METQYESSWKKTFLKKNLKYISRKEILGKRAAADSILTFLWETWQLILVSIK